MRIDNLLHERSWSWIGLNRGKEKEEPHKVLIVVQEISVCRDIEGLIKELEECKEANWYLYDKLFISEETIKGESGKFIIGERLETLQESILRIEKTNRVEEIKKSEDIKLLAKKKSEKIAELTSLLFLGNSEGDFSDYVKLCVNFLIALLGADKIPQIEGGLKEGMSFEFREGSREIILSVAPEGRIIYSLLTEKGSRCGECMFDGKSINQEIIDLFF